MGELGSGRKKTDTVLKVTSVLFSLDSARDPLMDSLLIGLEGRLVKGP